MTAPLAKAILLRLKQIPGKGKNEPTRVEPEERGAFPVQFNPTSLKITRQNNIDKGGSTIKTQRRQTPSTQSATLSFELEFDTAEGDASGRPVDVRTRTLAVRQFVEPTKEKPKDPPPPVRFIWGTFTFTGIVTSLTEDLDYFSPDGRPLRAKLSVTITEQNADYEAKLAGGPARTAQATTRPGEAGSQTGPGAPPAKNPDSAAVALGGESLQQLLTRMDADPATWRAAMEGLESPLRLAAGTQVQLSAAVSASAGIGVSGGFAAGVEARAVGSLAGALGLSGAAGLAAQAGVLGAAGISAGGLGGGADVGIVAGGVAQVRFGELGAGVAAVGLGGTTVATGSAAAGFALAEGGGVAASAQVVLADQTAKISALARASFDVPRSRQPRPTRAARPAQLTVDPRTLGYGLGVPLRARVQLR